MLFSEAEGRKVVSTTTADTIGKVHRFVVDPVLHSVVAVTVKKAKRGDTLRWTDMTAFGVDAVTVIDADKVTPTPDELAPLVGKQRAILHRRVLTVGGDEIGTVDDVEFDPATGLITNLILKEDQIDAARLIGIGSFAVVIAVDH